ncbi:MULTISPECIES: protein-glutamate O-methyltransferase CheR [unclassified Sphingomonas]|uniref:CheR family methyltransferase n=1 Tax=unclassified Sphingomonas TaxID=196159 RepID=UPI001F57F7CD|nr:MULTISPECIES: protein-glutamate O-methyltransferase CheR [unclassified Sphingomonas]
MSAFGLASAPVDSMSVDALPVLGDAEFAGVARIMQSAARIHLSSTKRTLVQSRLVRRLREHRLDTFQAYLALVDRDAEERRLMVTALTTNHTHFFRESHHFEHFRSALLPRLQARPADRPIRIWSAGCSSGEEVYSIAMSLLGETPAEARWIQGRDVKLLATDLSQPVVEATRRACYPAETVEPIPAAYRKAWLAPHDGGYRVGEAVRRLVTARVLNLFEPWPMKQRYDAIFCRNVMIYFDDVAKAELEARLIDQLAPDGFLYIGHSERLIGEAAERMRGCGQTIYARREQA